MAKKRWASDSLDEKTFWDKLGLCILLVLSTTTYEERENTYDNHGDKLKGPYDFVVNNYSIIPENSICKQFRLIFDKTRMYTTLSEEIEDNSKERILDYAKQMIVQEDFCFLQTIKFVLQPRKKIIILFFFYCILIFLKSLNKDFVFLPIRFSLILVFLLVIAGCSIPVRKKIETKIKDNRSSNSPEIQNKYITKFGECIEKLFRLFLKVRMEKIWSWYLKRRLQSFCNFNFPENEITKLLNFYSREFGIELSREKNEERLFSEYPKLKQFFPSLFDFCRDKGILDENDHFIGDRKDQRMVLFVINKYKPKFNDIDFLIRFLQPSMEKGTVGNYFVEQKTEKERKEREEIINGFIKSYKQDKK